ncbi:hypothetical protein V1477_001170 [Vespula maculifrons]|uniref:Uncharacterized protein n=1 Tax=Vespula maculifrons TaxID=7453 RepID=A0ABD2CZQ8_VESMC
MTVSNESNFVDLLLSQSAPLETNYHCGRRGRDSPAARLPLNLPLKLARAASLTRNTLPLRSWRIAGHGSGLGVTGLLQRSTGECLSSH